MADWEFRIGVYRMYYAVGTALHIVAIERIAENLTIVFFARGDKNGYDLDISRIS